MPDNGAPNTPIQSQTINCDHNSKVSDSIQAVINDNKGNVYIKSNIYTTSEEEKLHIYINDAVKNYELKMERILKSSLTPMEPYKSLYAYDIEDKNIFFGRENECREFLDILTKDRITILHGKSGIGKTSFLKAGVAPKLIEKGYLPVYARVFEDPLNSIKRSILPPSRGEWPEQIKSVDLPEFLGLVCSHLSHEIKELTIILDQFEEFFIFYPHQDHRVHFIDSLEKCIHDRDMRVRFIISIRKDYFSDLTDFEDRIPTILRNHYLLKNITPQDAKDAITLPLVNLDRPLSYESGLSDMLLKDLLHRERGGSRIPRPSGRG